MLKPLVLFALLVQAGAGVLAQQPPAQVSDVHLQKCLLGTFDDRWNALRLSEDQLHRIRLVQSACREECEGAGVRKTNNPISNANGRTVLDEVKNILTVEQYAAWVAFCSEGQDKGGPGK
jgi:hypothetical protein